MENFDKIDYVKEYPKLYENSTRSLWDDPHTSKYMLEAHLSPNWDAATRKMDFVNKSVNWISSICKSNNKKLLDLGCGPGLYAELFCKKGYNVTGIDFSKRSIAYAKEQAKKNNLKINYIYQNYLDIDYLEEFDIIVLIYCDFGVLSFNDRKILLKKVYKALKKGGVFICDAWSLFEKDNFVEGEKITYEENGFWSSNPYKEIERKKYYSDTNNTLTQHIIINEEKTDYINIWNQCFSKDSLIKELTNGGFNKEVIEFYNDVSGAIYDEKKNERTICFLVRK